MNKKIAIITYGQDEYEETFNELYAGVVVSFEVSYTNWLYILDNTKALTHFRITGLSLNPQTGNIETVFQAKESRIKPLPRMINRNDKSDCSQ